LGLEGAQLLVLARPAQLLGGELQLGERLVERVLGDELLLEELLRAVGLLLRDVDARLRRLELPGRLGARAGESERGALGARRQLDQHLAALHVVAALDRHRLDDRLHGTADLDRLPRFDHAVVLELRGARRAGEPADEQGAGGNAVHGGAFHGVADYRDEPIPAVAAASARPTGGISERWTARRFMCSTKASCEGSACASRAWLSRIAWRMARTCEKLERSAPGKCRRGSRPMPARMQYQLGGGKTACSTTPTRPVRS